MEQQRQTTIASDIHIFRAHFSTFLDQFGADVLRLKQKTTCRILSAYH
jgi:hypothetical protein